MTGVICRPDHGPSEGLLMCEGVHYEKVWQYEYFHGPFWAYIAAYVGLALLAGENKLF